MADDIKHLPRRLRPPGKPPWSGGAKGMLRQILSRLAVALAASQASLLLLRRNPPVSAFLWTAYYPVALVFAVPTLSLVPARASRVAPRTICRKR